MIKTFNEIAKDYKEYYKAENFWIDDLYVLEDVIYDLYGAEYVSNINYEDRTIEIF